MTLNRRGFLWAVAALLGIAVTAALTWSVSRLAAEHIGLSSEPISVIQGLAPPHAKPHPRSVATTEHSNTTPAHASSTPKIALPSMPQPTTPVTTPATAPPQAQTLASQTAPSVPPVAHAAAAHNSGRDHPDDSGSGGSGRHRSGPDD